LLLWSLLDSARCFGCCLLRLLLSAAATYKWAFNCSAASGSLPEVIKVKLNVTANLQLGNGVQCSAEDDVTIMRTVTPAPVVTVTADDINKFCSSDGTVDVSFNVATDVAYGDAWFLEPTVLDNTGGLIIDKSVDCVSNGVTGSGECTQNH
jgi:hypothetical protein